MKRIKIANRFVGKEDLCLVIAEAGVNHNNDPKRAIQLAKKAKEAGADVIKFQTYKANTIATKTAPRYWSPKLDRDGGGTQYDTFSRIDDLPLESYFDIKKECDGLGIIFCSTPFNLEDVSILEEIGVDIYKISSSDLTYPQLLKKVANKNKPIILSTGASSIGEIEEAVQVIRTEGNENIILQHCILSYPCEDEDANLIKMVKLQEVFPELPVGYSDHTRGKDIALAAVALGARSIEKHYTVDKSLPDSPDHLFGVDPDELRDLVCSIRRVEKSFGSFVNGPYDAEKKAYLYARKSVVAKQNIVKGTKITREMLMCKRPGIGIYPRFLDWVVGNVSAVDIKEDTTLTFDMFQR